MSYKIDEFMSIYGTSNNITLLREEVLNLLIKGKLNKATEFSSSSFLKSMILEKQKLLKSKQLRVEKIDDTFEPEYEKFNIPNNWKWAKVGELVFFNTGLTYNKNDLSHKNDKMIRVLRGGNIQELKYIFKDDDIMISPEFVNENLLLKKNQLILPAVSSLEQTAKLALVEKDYDDTVVGGFVLVATPYIYNELLSKYLFYAFNSKFHRENCRNITKKSGQAFYNLTRPKLVSIEIPLPPLEEMKEMIECTELLLAQIDKLEEQLKKKEHLLKQLPQAIVDSIGACKTGEELKEQLEFVIQNFETIFQTPESMQELRNVILQLAIEGKLVPQDPTDEPASELLKRIEAEREQLVKEKKIKKPSKLEPVSEDEIPFEVPESWAWVRLGQIMSFQGGYAFKSNTYVPDSMNQIIRLGNVKNGKLLLDAHPAFIPNEIANENEKYRIEENDILVTMTGTKNKRDYFYTHKVNLEDFSAKALYLNQRVGNLKASSLIITDYLVNTLKAPVELDMIFNTETGTANQGNIGSGSIENLLLPLPPVIEQGKIVEKVNSLMAIIDQLEEKLKKKVEITEMLGTA